MLTSGFNTSLRLPSSRTVFVAVFFVLVTWVAASVSLMQSIIASRVAQVTSLAAKDISATTEELNHNIEQHLNKLRGFPVIIANDKSVVEIMKGFGPAAQRTALTIGQQGEIWSKRPDILGLNKWPVAATRGLELALK